MSEQVEIELGELSSPGQEQEPFEETRFNPDDSERYGHLISIFSLRKEINVIMKGFVTIQSNLRKCEVLQKGALLVHKAHTAEI